MRDDVPALGLLWRTLPSWFVFPSRESGNIRGFAGLKHGVSRRGMLTLTIAARGRSASVKETDPLRLPDWCPELHLNGDRTFCLGLDKLPITDEAHAHQWWADLAVHLDLMSVAIKTRVWPLHSGLSHGDAGQYQREARLLAERLDLSEDYARALAGDESWLADLDMNLLGSNGKRRPSAHRCPCGCRRKSGSGFSWSNCPRRTKVDRLILLEHARRLALAEFWQSCRMLGRKCCGRMRDCPLATGSCESFDEAVYQRTLVMLLK